MRFAVFSALVVGAVAHGSQEPSMEEAVKPGGAVSPTLNGTTNLTSSKKCSSPCYFKCDSKCYKKDDMKCDFTVNYNCDSTIPGNCDKRKTLGNATSANDCACLAKQQLGPRPKNFRLEKRGHLSHYPKLVFSHGACHAYPVSAVMVRDSRAVTIDLCSTPWSYCDCDGSTPRSHCGVSRGAHVVV